MKKAIIGKKVGMTQIFDDAGKVGEATHDRFIIESAPFLAKAEAKKELKK